MRFCKNWIIYADDCTVRTGRVVDGTVYSDEEYAQRIEAAGEVAEQNETKYRQDLSEAFKALGFDPTGLGEENEPKKTQKTKITRPKAKTTKKTKRI